MITIGRRVCAVSRGFTVRPSMRGPVETTQNERDEDAFKQSILSP
jgi:hypothetical protein